MPRVLIYFCSETSVKQTMFSNIVHRFFNYCFGIPFLFHVEYSVLPEWMWIEIKLKNGILNYSKGLIEVNKLLVNILDIMYWCAKIKSSDWTLSILHVLPNICWNFWRIAFKFLKIAYYFYILRTTIKKNCSIFFLSILFEDTSIVQIIL